MCQLTLSVPLPPLLRQLHIEYRLCLALWVSRPCYVQCRWKPALPSEPGAPSSPSCPRLLVCKSVRLIESGKGPVNGLVSSGNRRRVVASLERAFLESCSTASPPIHFLKTGGNMGRQATSMPSMGSSAVLIDTFA